MNNIGTLWYNVCLQNGINLLIFTIKLLRRGGFWPRFGYSLCNYDNCAIFSYDGTRNIVDYPFKGLALK